MLQCIWPPSSHSCLLRSSNDVRGLLPTEAFAVCCRLTCAAGRWSSSSCGIKGTIRWRSCEIREEKGGTASGVAPQILLRAPHSPQKPNPTSVGPFVIAISRWFSLLFGMANRHNANWHFHWLITIHRCVILNKLVGPWHVERSRGMRITHTEGARSIT